MELPLLEVRDAGRWRDWLRAHHATSAGVWLVFHKGHTGRPSVPYEDAVRHALCYGWIDSLIKRLDDDRYARKFTPRRPTSNWSAINRRRWAELQESGLLEPAGAAAAPTGKVYAPRPHVPKLPRYIAEVLKSDARAWASFQSLAPGCRREYVVWIHTAKRPETRAKRVRESIAMLAEGKRLGLK